MKESVLTRLADIRADESAQQRAQLDWLHVAELKEAYEINAEIPAIVVFKDEEGLLWLADGFHRYEGAQKAGKEKIQTVIESGNLRSAILYSCGANSGHGLKRTNADKTKSADTLLSDHEWQQWNNTEIARKTGLSIEFIRQRRAVVCPETEGQTKVTRNGKTYTQSARKPKKQQAPDDVALQLMKDSPAADDPKQIDQLAQLPADRQLEVADMIRNEEAKSVNEAQKILNRKDLDAEPLPAGKFNLIYADPPWEYDNTGGNPAADKQYPTMSLENLKALLVPEMAADRAVLFLWGTVPLAAEAHELIKAWGFEYKSKFAWVKNTVVRGFYNMGQYEELYIATKGVHVVPEVRKKNVLQFDTREHSRKPDEILELINELYPEFKERIELFAREPRQGWQSWGYETEKFAA